MGSCAVVLARRVDGSITFVIAFRRRRSRVLDRLLHQPLQPLAVTTQGAAGSTNGSKRSIASRGTHRHDRLGTSRTSGSSEPTRRRGSTPGSRSVASLSEPSRLASRRPSGVDGQRDVAEARHGPAEGAVEQDLPRRAGDQVGAADDLVDAHRGVVDDHGELIGRADDRVRATMKSPPSSGWVELDSAQEEVVPGDRSRRARGTARRTGDRRGARRRPHVRCAQVPG